MKKCSVFGVVVLGLTWPMAAMAVTSAGWVADGIAVPGEAADLTPDVEGVRAEINRLNFGSDLWYDPMNRLLYGLSDAGPGPGTFPYETRLHVFTLDVDPATGRFSNFHLIRTCRFKTADGSQNYTGQDPTLANGGPYVLGNCLDPEGIAVDSSGNVYVSDEIGPSLYKFRPVSAEGVTEYWFDRSYDVPSRWLPRDADGNINYDATASTVPAQVSGRQSGRGLECLTLSPDGATLTCMFQDPFQEEGNRRSRNVRLARIDVATGQCLGEYVYQLESVADINTRVPPEVAFGPTQQGRNVGANAIIDLGGGRYLVLERDNRGIGIDNPTNAHAILSHVGTKRVYEIDLSGATDISAIGLPASGELPPGVAPVGKTVFLDMYAALQAIGWTVADKPEGMTLVQGERPYLIVATDNDYSALDVVDPVTGELTMWDVCTDGTLIPMNSDLGGRHLLPSHLYSFAVPEPGTLALLAAGLLAAAVLLLRRRRG